MKIEEAIEIINNMKLDTDDKITLAGIATGIILIILAALIL